jgi:hypothetical protein
MGPASNYDPVHLCLLSSWDYRVSHWHLALLLITWVYKYVKISLNYTFMIYAPYYIHHYIGGKPKLFSYPTLSTTQNITSSTRLGRGWVPSHQSILQQTSTGCLRIQFSVYTISQELELDPTS